MEAFLDRIAGVVARLGDDPAIADSDKQYNYSELDAASDRLARLLDSTRLTENDVCGFVGGPGVDRIVTYLACIKAGHCMIRLDPEAADTLLQDLIETCDITRVIAEPGYESRAKEILPVEPLTVPADPPVRSEIAPFRRPDCDPGSLVVIQFTSGSTGRPKCVPYTRGQFDERLTRKYQVSEPPVTPRNRVPFFTHLRVTQELVDLQNGSFLDCFDLRRHGVAAAADWMIERGVNVITGQVALCRQIIAAANRPFPAVRSMIVVGESVLRSDIEDFERVTQPGTTFATRFSSTEHCDIARFSHRNGDPISYDILPVGKNLYPDDVKLVTEDGRLAAPGEPGEVVVIGDFLPCGYLKDPERTTAAFGVDPESGHRTYRTGFVAYADHNGLWQPYGRKDELVKIRGYNVRPSEVESAVQSHPGVREAAVRPFEGAKGIRRLACFYVPEAESPASPSEIRTFVAAKAPNYFVPAIIHPIDALPRSHTGKITRSQLPDPLALLAGDDGPAEISGTPTEKHLGQIWADLLGHRNFGPSDDFFDVGGDSLQAMAMLVEIEKQTNVRIPLETLILDGATLQKLAERFDQAKSNTPAPARAIQLRHGSGGRTLFATHVVGGHLSDYLGLANTLSGDLELTGLHPCGLHHGEPPAATMEEIAQDAIDAMRQHQPNGPYQILGYSFGALIAYAMAERLTSEGELPAMLILLDPPPVEVGITRFTKSALRPLKKGQPREAAQRMTQAIPAALGLRGSPADINQAHRTAVLRYRPSPLTGVNALLVSATVEPCNLADAGQWKLLLGGDVPVRQIQSTHADMVRQPAVFELAQIVQAFLAEHAVGSSENGGTAP